MLIFPIINKRKVMNVEIKIKDAKKIRKNVHYDDAKSEEIIVNNERFSNSSFNNIKSDTANIDFIRSKSILYSRKFLVTTKENSSSPKYDIYELPSPPKKVNTGLDRLYNKAILDMQKEVPDRSNRGRYVSFKDLDIDIPEERIIKLKQVLDNGKEEKDSILENENLVDLKDSIDFINTFEYTIITDSIITEESLQDTLKALSTINTRDYRNLKKYYSMAKSNTEIFTKYSYLSKIIYDKPLTLYHSNSIDEKLLIKKKNEGELKNVA